MTNRISLIHTTFMYEIRKYTTQDAQIQNVAYSNLWVIAVRIADIDISYLLRLRSAICALNDPHNVRRNMNT